MTTIAYPEETRISVGVDTHKDSHMVAVKDGRGRHLAERSIPTTAKGYEDLLLWVRSMGKIEAFGVEGTGSYGKGLTLFLRTQGEVVIEVNRADQRRGVRTASQIQ